MADYSEEIADAKEMIAEFGQKVIWRKNLVEAPSKSWRPSSTEKVDYEVTIVFLPRDRTNTQAIRASAEGIQIGNVYGLMAQVPFEPKARDIVIRDGQECRIFAIDVLAPAGEPILYTIDFDL